MWWVWRGLAVLGTVMVAALAGVAVAAVLMFGRPEGGAERLAEVEQLARKGVEAGRWPGMMWAVVAPGEVLAVGAAGFADLELGREMTAETTMPIGSISKVIVGLAMGQAILDGDLDPEAPLAGMLSVPFDAPDGMARTAEQLATHSAGILDLDAVYEDVGYFYEGVTHPVELGAFLGRAMGADGDLYFEGANFGAWAPGTRYSYSNIGAGLAAQVVADATGAEFVGYSQAVLAPLGLSGFWGQAGPAPEEAAQLYGRDEAGGLAVIPPYGIATWPDGQYNASARDLARLMAAMMGEGRIDGRQALPEALVREVTRPRLTGVEPMGPEEWVGLFWGQETQELWPFSFTYEGHSGGDPGVVTFMYRSPDSPTGFVLMVNGEPRGMRDIVELIRIVRLLDGAVID